ncbi:unnamed protein product [Calicophoron daubneyi]|uniref:C2H2-type domain-containing protein n=1 Tax=Calicophoron daubneyi TaxID=300641 RepID=A0AAV2T5H0_CALDB
MAVCIKNSENILTQVPDSADCSSSSCPASASSEESVPEGYLILTFDKGKQAKLKTAIFADVSDPRFADDLGDDEAMSNSEWSSNESPQAATDSTSCPPSSGTSLPTPTPDKTNSEFGGRSSEFSTTCYGEAVWVGEDPVTETQSLNPLSNRTVTNVPGTVDAHSLIRNSPIEKNSAAELLRNRHPQLGVSSTQLFQSKNCTKSLNVPLGVDVPQVLTRTNSGYSRHSSLSIRLANKHASDVSTSRLSTQSYFRSGSYQRSLFSDSTRSSMLDGGVRHSRKMLRCEGCGKYYRNEYSLNHHICLKRKDVWKKGDVPSEMVDGQIIYFCPTCHKPFKWLGNLTRHFYVHTGQRFFKCDVCAKEFFSAYQVKRHMNSHTGMRFKCEVCDKPFTCKYACAWHTRQHYTYVE